MAVHYRSTLYALLLCTSGCLFHTSPDGPDGHKVLHPTSSGMHDGTVGLLDDDADGGVEEVEADAATPDDGSAGGNAGAGGTGGSAGGGSAGDAAAAGQGGAGSGGMPMAGAGGEGGAAGMDGDDTLGPCEVCEDIGFQGVCAAGLECTNIAGQTGDPRCLPPCSSDTSACIATFGLLKYTCYDDGPTDGCAPNSHADVDNACVAFLAAQ